MSEATISIDDILEDPRFKEGSLNDRSSAISRFYKLTTGSGQEALLNSKAYEYDYLIKNGSSQDAKQNTKKLNALIRYNKHRDIDEFGQEILQIGQEAEEENQRDLETLPYVAKLAKLEDLTQNESGGIGEGVTDFAKRKTKELFGDLDNNDIDTTSEHLKEVIGEDYEQKVADYRLSQGQFEGNSTLDSQGDIVLKNNFYVRPDVEIVEELQNKGIPDGKIQRFLQTVGDTRESLVKHTIDTFDNDSARSALSEEGRRQEGESEIDYTRRVLDYNPENGFGTDASGIYQSFMLGVGGLISSGAEVFGASDTAEHFRKRNAVRSNFIDKNVEGFGAEILSGVAGALPGMVPVAKSVSGAKLLSNFFKLSQTATSRMGVAAMSTSAGAVSGAAAFDQAVASGEMSRGEAASLGFKQAFITGAVTLAGFKVTGGLEDFITVSKTGQLVISEVAKGKLRNHLFKKFGKLQLEGVEEGVDESLSHLLIEMEMNPLATPEEAVDAAIKAYQIGVAMGSPGQFLELRKERAFATLKKELEANIDENGTVGVSDEVIKFKADKDLQEAKNNQPRVFNDTDLETEIPNAFDAETVEAERAKLKEEIANLDDAPEINKQGSPANDTPVGDEQTDTKNDSDKVVDRRRTEATGSKTSVSPRSAELEAKSEVEPKGDGTNSGAKVSSAVEEAGKADEGREIPSRPEDSNSAKEQPSPETKGEIITNKLSEKTGEPTSATAKVNVENNEVSYDVKNGNASVSVKDDNTLEITSLDSSSEGQDVNLVNEIKADAERQNRDVIVTVDEDTETFYESQQFTKIEGTNQMVYEGRDAVLDNDPDTDLVKERATFGQSATSKSPSQEVENVVDPKLTSPIEKAGKVITKKDKSNFKSEASVKTAIKREGLSPDDFDIVKQDDGGFIGQEKLKTEEVKEKLKTEEVKEKPKTEEVKEKPKTEKVKEKPKTKKVEEKLKTKKVEEKPKTEEVKEKPKSVIVGENGTYSTLQLSKVDNVVRQSNTAAKLKSSDSNVKFLNNESQEVNSIISKVQSTFGTNHEVLFFKTDDPTAPDGFFDSDTNTVFVNTNTQRPLETIIVHESLHALEVQNPKLYKNLEANLVKSGLRSPNKRQGRFVSRYLTVDKDGNVTGGKDLTFKEYMVEAMTRAYLDASSLGRFEKTLNSTATFNKFVKWFSSIVNKVNLKLRDATYSLIDSKGWKAMGSFRDSYSSAHILSETLNISRVSSTASSSNYMVNVKIVEDFKETNELFREAGVPSGVSQALTYLSKKADSPEETMGVLKRFLANANSLITGKLQKSVRPKRVKSDSTIVDEHVEFAEDRLFKMEPFKKFDKKRLTVSEYQEMITLVAVNPPSVQKAFNKVIKDLKNHDDNLALHHHLAPSVLQILFAKKVTDLHPNVKINRLLQLATAYEAVDIKYKIDGGITSVSREVSDAGKTLNYFSLANSNQGYKSYFFGSLEGLTKAQTKLIEKVFGKKSADVIDQFKRGVFGTGNGDSASKRLIEVLSQPDTKNAEIVIKRLAKSQVEMINRTLKVLRRGDANESKKDTVTNKSQREQAIEKLLEASSVLTESDWDVGQGLQLGVDVLNESLDIVDQALELDWIDGAAKKNVKDIEKSKSEIKDKTENTKAARQEQHDATDGVADTDENKYLRRRLKGAITNTERLTKGDKAKVSDISKFYNENLKLFLNGDLDITDVEAKFASKFGKSVDFQLLNDSLQADKVLDEIRQNVKNVDAMIREAFTLNSITLQDLRNELGYKDASLSKKAEIDAFIDAKQRKEDKLRDSKNRKKALQKLRDLAAANEEGIEAYKEGLLTSTELKYFTKFESLSDVEQNEIRDIIDAKQRKEDKLRDSKNRKKALQKLRDLRSIETALSQMSQNLPLETSILQKLGVDNFGVESANRYDFKTSSISQVEKVLPSYMKHEAGFIKNLIDNHVENQGDIGDLISDIAEIKLNTKPDTKPKFGELLASEIDNSDFDFENLEAKKEFIRKWLRTRSSNPALDQVLKSEHGSEGNLSESDIERFTLIALKRLDEGIETVVNERVNDISEIMDLGKLESEVLKKAMSIKMFNMGTDAHAAMTQALGKEFTMPLETVEKLLKIEEQIKKITKSQNINGEELIELRGVLLRDIVDEFKGLQPILGTELMEKTKAHWVANLFSSISTAIGLPAAGGASALVDSLTRRLLDLKGASSAERGRVVNEVKTLFAQSLGFGEQGFSIKDSMIDGWKNAAHAIGDQDALRNADTSMSQGSGLLAEELVRFFDTLDKFKTGESNIAQLGVRGIATTLSSSSAVFKVMGAMTNATANISRQLELGGQIEYWRRNGVLTYDKNDNPKTRKVTDAEFEAHRKFAQDQVQSYYDNFLNFTTMSDSEKRIRANRRYYNILFAEIGQDPDVVRNALIGADIMVNSATADNRKVIGIFTAITAKVNEFKNDISTGSGKVDKSLAVAIDILSFGLLVIPSASTSMDFILQYFPGSSMLMRKYANGTDRSKIASNSVKSRLLQNFDAMLDQGRIEKQLMHRQGIGVVTGLVFAAISTLINELGEEDEDPIFEITLGYPEDTKEQNRWADPNNRMRPHSIYFRAGGKQFSIDWGRGTLPQLAMAAYLVGKSGKISKILEKSDDASSIVGGLLGEITKGTVTDMVELGVPLLDSIMRGDNYTSDSQVVSQLNRKVSNFQPFAAFTRDIDIIFNGKRQYQTDKLGVGMIPIAQIFSDNGTMTVDGYGIVNGEKRQWAENLRLPFGILNRDSSTLSSEKQKNLKFISETGYYRGDKRHFRKFLSDPKMLGDKTPEEIQKILSQNGVSNEAELYARYMRVWSNHFLSTVGRSKNKRGISKVKNTLSELRKQRIDLQNEKFTIFNSNKAKELKRVEDAITKIMGQLGGDATTYAKKKLRLSTKK